MAHTRSCIYCNKIVQLPKYRLKNFKYCSRSCLFKHKEKTEIIIKNCFICFKEYKIPKLRDKKAKYCSRKCYYKSSIGRGKTLFKCLNCNNDFYDSLSTERKYCSQKCKKEYKIINGNCSFSFARKAFKSRGWITHCNKCGYSERKEILGIHHSDHNRKNNIPSNLIVLCPNCHSLEHKKHIVHS